MKDTRTFWKKNGLFLLILTSLVVISLSLFLYTFITHREKEPPQLPVEDAPQTSEEISEDAAITSFEGSYSKTTQQIDFGWSYEKGKADIQSVKLYLGDRELMNVTSYTTYSLPRELYDIPTGHNNFRLVITQENGNTVEKSTKVFVNYVTYMEQEVKAKNNSMEISLVYRYEKSNPVAEPTLLLLESIPYKELVYRNTEVEETDGIVEARTTYEIFWNEYSEDVNVFSVRWSFANHSENNQDFTIDKTPVSMPKEEE